MKIAVAGASGYIGKYLCKELKHGENISELLEIGRGANADAYLNLQEAENFRYDALNDVDVILFAAAVSGPDQCAKEFEKSWEINVTGTSFFIREALNRNCKVLFFSSDAVFGDRAGTVYTELSETQSTTPYGRMKKTVEDTFKDFPGFKAVRLSYVVSGEDKFIRYCISCIREGKTAEVYHPFYRNCISRENVLSAVRWLVNHWDTYRPVFLNLAGSELVSRVRIADELNRMFDGKLRYEIIFPGEDFYQNRPKITQMKSLYITQYGILEQMSFTEQIQKEFKGVRI
jgi:dTDP-4-dehydrorhamnose reductase